MTSSLPPIHRSVTHLLTAVLRFAAEHHRAGRRSEATTLYREVLALDPRHADALFLLGVLAREDGHLQEAQRLLTEAGRWAASRTLIDAELQLVARLRTLGKRKPAQPWHPGALQSADGCALATTARA